MAAQFILASETPQFFAGPVRLVAGCQRLGRSKDCDIVLAHETVSRCHAEIILSQETVHVRDLQSFNGTYVNEQAVSASDLQSGDRLRVGAISLILVKGHVQGEEGSTAPCGTPERSPEWRAAAEALSPAEYRIFEMLVDGFAEKRIASQLKISPHTVHNHVRAIYSRLDVHSRPELMAKILRGSESSRAIAK